MRIDNELEYRAAKELCRRYRFDPYRTQKHPMQKHLQSLADAMKYYERQKSQQTNHTSDQL